MDFTSSALTVLQALKVGRQPELKSQWQVLRDTLFKLILDRTEDLRSVLILAKKFQAEQVFVKVVFLGGPSFYEDLHSQV